MDDSARIVELELVPISPDTVDSTRATVGALIEEALRSTGQLDLLREGDIKVEVRQTFPADIVITVVITLVTGVAVETYGQVILPWLMKRFGKGRETERSTSSMAP